MSVATRAPTAHLAEPSGTAAIEADFVGEIRTRSKRIRGLVRRTVGYQNDALSLKQDAQLASEREYFPTTSRVQGFSDWFDQVLRDELFETISISAARAGEHWSSEYVRRAYLAAWQQAGGRLRAEGFGAPQMAVEAIIQLPVPKQQLRDLYQRTYSNLSGVSKEMAQAVREELTQGLAEGINPKEMANRLTDEVRKLERSRLETIARTEVINSHTEATLDRYERAGAGTVMHGEWADADDSRVCPICSFLDGNEYAIGEFRTGTFTFEPGDDDPDYLAGTYPIRPPAHPNCRCSILPVIT